MTLPPRRSSSSSLSSEVTVDDKGVSSSCNDFEETEVSSHFFESSSFISLQYEDDSNDNDEEEPTTFVNDSRSKATTNHAICSPSSESKSSSRRRQQVKPQTPREQWFCGCCCGHNDVDDYAQDEAHVTRILRYCRLISPHPQEHPIKKRIRHLLWWTILLDLTVAVVASLSFDEFMTCCGEPILTLPRVDNNHQVIQIVLYVYLGLVLVQILPVVREGCVPWNLMNPIFGFVLGFVLFFVKDDNAPMAALVIWILQISSVALEFVAYRHYSILHMESKQRLERANDQLQLLAQRNKSNGGYQQNKRERIRRELQLRHAKSLYRLRKHMIGVSINILLVIATLLLIVYVARQKGMCIKDGGTPSLFLFHNEDEMECDVSEGKRYAICNADSGESECYFPFF